MTHLAMQLVLAGATGGGIAGLPPKTERSPTSIVFI